MATSLCLSSSFEGKFSFIFLSIPIVLVNNLSIVILSSWSFVVILHSLFKSLMNSLFNICSIAFLLEVKEFIISKLFNIFCFISLLLKGFCTFSWNSLIASLMKSSANFSCPGSFNNSLAIWSAFLVIVSSLANLARISNNFIKIFWFAIISAFSLLDKVNIFNNSIALLAKFRFWVLSIICKSNLGHPNLTNKLHIIVFFFASVIKVFMIESHKSSSFNDLFNNFIKELMYISEGVLFLSSDNSFSLSLKNATFFLNWVKWSIRFWLSVDL